MQGTRSLVALTAVAALAISTRLEAQQVPQSPSTPLPPQVVVTAQGETRITPDRAAIFIGVQTRSATAAQASAENARKQRAVLDTLRALGIPNERISTMEYNVYPEQRYEPQRGDSAPKITGYNVVNTVRVEVHRTQDLGRIIDAVLAKGANGINSLQFFAANTDDARRTALGNAVSRARADAEAIARAAGGQLGELMELNATPFEPPRPYPMAMARVASEAAQTPISPGEQTLSVTVMARWRFVAGAR
ncbi:MAG TPA: SIMPL domain-containing protein [Gemmatimonadaceae bacterium]|nr:SIMPL domain-containing protein [Gemmatimonadaceae bacterium]